MEIICFWVCGICRYRTDVRVDVEPATQIRNDEQTLELSRAETWTILIKNGPERRIPNMYARKLGISRTNDNWIEMRQHWLLSPNFRSCCRAYPLSRIRLPNSSKTVVSQTISQPLFPTLAHRKLAYLSGKSYPLTVQESEPVMSRHSRYCYAPVFNPSVT